MAPICNVSSNKKINFFNILLYLPALAAE